MVPSKTFELKSHLIQAGAGTGKTYSLVEKVFEISRSYKEKQGRYPHILVCTFTRKATQELKERLFKKAIEEKDLDLLDYINSTDCYISTFHGIASFFINRYGYKYGWNVEKISSEEQNRISDNLTSQLLFNKYPHLLQKCSFSKIKEALELYAKKSIMYKQTHLFTEKELAALEKQDINSKEDFVQAFKKRNEKTDFRHEDFGLFFKDFSQAAEDFCQEFLKQTQAAGIASIDIIELWFLEILQNQSKLPASINQDWDYWFIDEYQDTSLLQEKIVETITRFQGVFCVGDPKQSIYTWRNADPSVFQRRIERAETQEKLTDNRRSQASLVHFFNDFFKKDQGFLHLKPKEPAKASVPMTLVYYEKEEREQAILARIESLYKLAGSYKDICILGFKNEDLSEISLFLKNKNIPIQFLAKSHFFKRRLILDACFLLKFLLNPHDDENLISLLRTPYFKLKDASITKLCDLWYEACKQKKISLWSWSKTQKVKAWPILKILDAYLDVQQEQGFLKTFEKILLERGFMDLSSLKDPSGLEEANLWKFLQLLHKNEIHKKHPLSSYYEFIYEDLEDQDSENEVSSFFEDNSCKLMTIHSSKGLEFKHVCILNEMGRPQTQECIFDPEAQALALSVSLEGLPQKSEKCYAHKRFMEKIQEERLQEQDRLLYVAMTRAKETVTLFLPKTSQTHANLGSFDFFQEKLGLQDKKSLPKPGKYKEEKYTFEVQEFSGSSSVLKKSSKQKYALKKPIIHVEAPDFVRKNSSDFLAAFKQEEDFTLPKSLAYRMFLARRRGSYLHEILQLASQLPLDDVEKKISFSPFPDKEKQDFSQALEWLVNLKDPDMSQFLKQGFPEWSFTLKKSKALLEGQIDLWARKQDKIYVFDYKSADSDFLATRRQLSFYSYVLDEIYKPQEIIMYSLYPFKKTFKKVIYEKKHQEEMSKWIESL